MNMQKETQAMNPLAPAEPTAGVYNIDPVFPLDEAHIDAGFEALAKHLSGQVSVLIDGFSGVLWQSLRDRLALAFHKIGRQVNWIPAESGLKTSQAIHDLITNYLGGDDPLFGKRCPLDLDVFFQDRWTTGAEARQAWQDGQLNIIYGTGAFLSGIDGYRVYVDVPKNEILYRLRAGVLVNLGHDSPQPEKVMYKRYYFVDWQVLNRQKRRWLPHIDLIVDGQREDDPVMMSGDDLRKGLEKMTVSFVRVRPWFQPAPWGGNYMKEHFPRLPGNVPNYGWSYELIAPENGITFSSHALSLEVSFDFLLYNSGARMMGEHVYQQFDCEWPVRINFLDTMDGGNLSLQCHPQNEYIQKEFGEKFTQDECYYIMDCKNQAVVYLGFQDDIDPAAFRAALLDSQQTGRLLDVEHFVQTHPSEKHGLYLIPGGTVHASGKDNLVMEISATTYNYTFKMYDWQRMDLDGKPRPINIDRAFANLVFSRKGPYVKDHLIAHATCLQAGPNWRLVHLPTHARHFYDVHRIEFTGSVNVDRDEDSFHILTLAEGRQVTLTAGNGLQHQLNYLESLIVPFAAGPYVLTAPEDQEVKVLKTFVKP